MKEFLAPVVTIAIGMLAAGALCAADAPPGTADGPASSESGVKPPQTGFTDLVTRDSVEMLLWPNGAPGSEGRTDPEVITVTPGGERQVTSVHKPSIMPFVPQAKPGQLLTAVLVIPGGGHRMLCVDHEGVFVATRLNAHGVAAFVLKYRLAREQGSTYTIKGNALADTQRAIRYIRANAGKWNIDPARVGVMGFSAGGELASLASEAAGQGNPTADDPVERADALPAFQALIYPGASNEIQPAKDSPPAFLLCSANDRKDISEGLAEAYLRFKRAGGVAEFHSFATGGHGFGVRPSTPPPLGEWPELFVDWLRTQKFL